MTRYVALKYVAIIFLAGCTGGVPALGPKERDAVARHELGLARCYAIGFDVGSKGGKNQEAGLAAFDECMDGGK